MCDKSDHSFAELANKSIFDDWDRDLVFLFLSWILQVTSIVIKVSLHCTISNGHLSEGLPLLEWSFQSKAIDQPFELFTG